MIAELRVERLQDVLARYTSTTTVTIHPFLWHDISQHPTLKSMLTPPRKGMHSALLVNDVFHEVVLGETGDPTVVMIVASPVETTSLRIVKWTPLSDFTDNDLLKELARRSNE